MSEFKGSIAQTQVQFPIETVIEPIAGEAYSRAMIFMHANLAAENLPDILGASAGSKIELDSSSYASITGGGLKKWLVPFFTLAQTSKIAIVLYDTDTTEEREVDDGQGGTTTETVTVPATCSMSTAYERFKFWAYFKFAYAELSDYVSVQTELATLCKPDSLYSDFWVGVSDTNVLTKNSTLITQLNSAEAKYRAIYNPDSNINAALAQLGDTLATANSTGTPIGNDIDYHSFAGIKASGALVDDERTNLTATEKTALDEQHIGYQTYVGDGTENVVTEGSLYNDGDSVGASWIKHYLEYVNKIDTANFITQRNRFRSNSEYQAILTLLSARVKPFVDLGRLADFTLTAPPFSALPKSADSIVVPDAWRAQYIDRIRSVAVYGKLYITQASK